MLPREIIPGYVFILGLIGILFLTISAILWAVFYFYFYQSVNNTVNPPAKKKTGHDIVGYTNLVIGIVGFIFSSFLIYGLILYNNFDLNIPRRRDPLIKIDNPNILTNKQPYTNLRYKQDIQRSVAPY